MAVAPREGIFLPVNLLLVADEINTKKRGWRSLFRVRNRLAPLAHHFRVLVEPLLDGFKNMLVLPRTATGA